MNLVSHRRQGRSLVGLPPADRRDVAAAGAPRHVRRRGAEQRAGRERRRGRTRGLRGARGARAEREGARDARARAIVRARGLRRPALAGRDLPPASRARSSASSRSPSSCSIAMIGLLVWLLRRPDVVETAVGPKPSSWHGRVKEYGGRVIRTIGQVSTGPRFIAAVGLERVHLGASGRDVSAHRTVGESSDVRSSPPSRRCSP